MKVLHFFCGNWSSMIAVCVWLFIDPLLEFCSRKNTFWASAETERLFARNFARLARKFDRSTKLELEIARKNLAWKRLELDIARKNFCSNSLALNINCLFCSVLLDTQNNINEFNKDFNLLFLFSVLYSFRNAFLQYF